MGPPCDVPLELVLVLDKSGSVRHAQSQMLQFAREVVGQFTLGISSARVGLVEFHHDASVLLGLSSSMSAFESALSGASSAGGLTSVSDGLEAGFGVLTASGRRGVPQALLLLTDGVQTADGDDLTAIASAGVLKSSGVQVFSVGFGGARASTMSAIASSASHFYMGSDMEEIRSHFASVSLCEVASSPLMPPSPPSPPPSSSSSPPLPARAASPRPPFEFFSCL